MPRDGGHRAACDRRRHSNAEPTSILLAPQLTAEPAVPVAPPEAHPGRVDRRAVTVALMTASDIVEIQQLLARSNTAIDRGDGPAFAACFTPDGVLDMGETGLLEGVAAIEAVAGTFAAALPGMRHWNNNHVIDIDGDTATATVYFVVVFAGPDARLGPSGCYFDQLRRTADGWRFVCRRAVVDAVPGPLPTGA